MNQKLHVLLFLTTTMLLTACSGSSESSSDDDSSAGGSTENTDQVLQGNTGETSNPTPTNNGSPETENTAQGPTTIDTSQDSNDDSSTETAPAETQPSEEQTSQEPSTETEEGSGGSPTATIDITDATFTKRDGSCADYEGFYSSDVMDTTNARNYLGNISVAVGASACTLESNTIPNHDFNDNTASFANDPAEVSTSYSIPINPTFAASNTELSLPVVEAVLLNGVSIDVLAAACYDVGSGQLGREKVGCGNNSTDINNPWRYDPMSSLNTFGTDQHNAHTQSNGKYHYHGNPNAMFTQDCSTAASASPVIGFAADGFPLYGSCISDGAGGFREVEPSYQLKSGTRQDVGSYTTPVKGVGTIKNDEYDGQFRGDYEYSAGLGDLDECNGMTVDGQYGYYITNAFPWVINCYKGTVNSSFSGASVETRRSHSHDDHTHSH